MPSSTDTADQGKKHLVHYPGWIQPGENSLFWSLISSSSHPLRTLLLEQEQASCLQTAITVQFLGLKGRESYLEPQILAAYEELASTVVEEGYSSRVQDGKLRMLEQAVDEVRNQNGTRIDSEIQVQWDDLPGALALLQEVRLSPPIASRSASPMACREV